MNKNLPNVIITGATSGIGLEASKLFVRKGVNVLMVGRHEKPNLVRDINREAENGAEAVFCCCDLSKAPEVCDMSAYAVKIFGAVCGLINNAAIFFPGMLHETGEEQWDQLFSCDVKSVFLTGKYILPNMMQNRKGSIVNVASISGLRGDYNMACYNAAKGAIVNLTRSMALDYGKYGIRTNAICPSACATPMFMKNPESVIREFCDANPMGRICQPEEVAQAMYFLLSDAASGINGAMLTVSGGMEAYSGQPIQK